MVSFDMLNDAICRCPSDVMPSAGKLTNELFALIPFIQLSLR